MVDIDSEALFNGAAAVVSTIAVGFFVLNVDYGHSPVSKIGLVVLFLTLVFAITQRGDDHQLTLLGYGVIVTSVVILFFDVAGTFEIGDALTVLGLLAIAALLFVLRTRLDEQSHFVSGSTATSLLGVVAAVVVVVLIVDVVTGGLVYELQPEREIEYTEQRGEPVRIASVVASNPTPFPEEVDAPNYDVCAAGNWSEFRPSSEPDEPPREVGAHARVDDGYNEYVFGYDAKTYPVTVNVNGENLQGETFPVERTGACPDQDTGPPYLALFTADAENYRYGRPV